ncbi:Glutamate receptor ionotropic, delta-1 [Amphibalanus amphitrite]|uniref:Glutamate receptor ionotropic, delta-1 n=1 Tax=Amphibalanus amphitrite TaxID=1232801 RepID=A0A6A4WFN3_AMPAM|nr:Glutamate receptor ionotropic, delta-1 [Amphibalanus amphitrite]
MTDGSDGYIYPRAPRWTAVAARGAMATRWLAAALALTLTGQLARGQSAGAVFDCVAAFLRHQGWSAVEVVVDGNLTGSESRALLASLSRRALFSRGTALPLLAATPAAGTASPSGADTLVVTRSAELRLTDGWRRRRNRVLVLCLGCSDGGYFLRRRFAGLHTATLSDPAGSVNFFDAKMWNRPGEELPVGRCAAGVYRPRRRPYDDFSVWSRGALTGVTLRVAVLAAPPPGAQVAYSNGTITGGVTGELLLALQRSLGFSYQLQVAAGEVPWVAVVRSVARGQTDVAGALLVGTPRRQRQLRLGQPAEQTHIGLALRRPGARRAGRGTVLRPFTGAAWTAVLTLLAALVAALLLAQPAGRRCATDALFAVVGMSCQQGVELAPRGAPARLVLFSGLAAAFVLYTTYSAVLLSFLAVDVTQLPFSSAAEFRAAGDWRYGTLNPAIAVLSPLAGVEPVSLARTLTEATRVFSESERLVVGATVSTMVKQLGCRHGGARCPFCVHPGVTARAYRGLAFRRDFPHTDLFDRMLLRLRASGALQRLIHSQGAGRLEDFMCPATGHAERADGRAMGLRDLKQVFCLVPMGVAVAFVVLVAERCLKQKKNELLLRY